MTVTLTETERAHLATLLAEPMTKGVLQKCIDQLVEDLRNQLESTTDAEPFRVVQGQIAAIRALWMILLDASLPPDQRAKAEETHRQATKLRSLV